MGAFVRYHYSGGCWLERRAASDGLDVVPADPEVLELTVVESGELTDGLLILGELGEFLADVHLFRSFLVRVLNGGDRAGMVGPETEGRHAGNACGVNWD